MADQRREYIRLELTKREGEKVLTASLVLKTAKGLNGGIRSSAHVVWTGDGMEQWMPFSDFGRTVALTSERATQRAIDSQHRFRFNPEVVAALTAEATAFYADIPSVTA